MKKLKDFLLEHDACDDGFDFAQDLTLMRDERSKNAVDIAIKFGENKATREELDAATYAADAASDAKKKNQKATADICRKYLPINIWDQSKL